MSGKEGGGQGESEKEGAGERQRASEELLALRLYRFVRARTIWRAFSDHTSS